METSDLDETTKDNRPQFGNRFLTDSENVFKHNAWDNVEWDEEQELQAKVMVDKNSKKTLTEEQLLEYEKNADKFWNQFYDIHENRFFKDRHWLFTEFPELAPHVNAPKIVLPVEQSNAKMETEQLINGPRKVFEIGCGVGNTILPILKYSRERELKIYGCDFSVKAIDILRKHPHLEPSRCEVFVMDATEENWIVPFEEKSIDIIVLIFVLSAIHPSKMKIVAKNCMKFLKSGGVILLRDYGRYDLAQLRFKQGKCLEENFYVRGDGTLVYFFTQKELKELFEGVGMVEIQNIVDRRLQVNRGKMLKMYRVWVQAKFCKP